MVYEEREYILPGEYNHFPIYPTYIYSQEYIIIWRKPLIQPGYYTVGVVTGTPKSSNNHPSQVTFVVERAIARNSTSVHERETVVCFLVFQKNTISKKGENNSKDYGPR